MPRNNIYQTQHEIHYVKGLATGKTWNGERGPNCDPADLLKNYISNAKKRRRNGTFGAIDAGKVIKYAEGLLNDIKSKGFRHGDNLD